MIKLSICFAAYNQQVLLKHNLDLLHTYPNDDIEVIISDDCSTEDLASLVSQYHDVRFRHIRSEHNLGHDGNILHGLRHCKSDFVMLMRSRDNVIPEAIPKIISCIEQNPDAGYFLFSARDETGHPRLQLDDRTYDVGAQTVWAQSNLLIHPSGGIYNRRYLRFGLYDAYCSTYFDHKYGFVAHQLMRADASVHGPFVTSSVFAWNYVNTLKATDVAVNSASNHRNVYAPEYVRSRYACEFDFARFELNGSMRRNHMAGVVGRYLELFLYHLPIIMRSEQYARHYDSDMHEYDLSREMDVIHRFTTHLAKGLDEESLRMIRHIERTEYVKACTLYPSMRATRRMLTLCKPLETAYRSFVATKVS